MVAKKMASGQHHSAGKPEWLSNQQNKTVNKYNEPKLPEIQSIVQISCEETVKLRNRNTDFWFWFDWYDFIFIVIMNSKTDMILWNSSDSLNSLNIWTLNIWIWKNIVPHSNALPESELRLDFTEVK